MPISSLLLNFLLFWGAGALMSRYYKIPAALKYVIQAGLALGLLWLIGTAAFYLFTPMFYDHAEASVASVGANWLQGFPIYTSMDSPERYSLMYGPVAFMCSAWIQSLGDQTILLAKLPGVFNLFLSGLLLLALCRRFELSWRSGLLGLSLFAASLLGMYHFSYWTRGDSYIMLFVVLALCAVVCLSASSSKWTHFLVALLIACSINTKIHSAIYFLPILFYFFEVKKMKWSWSGIGVGFVGFVIGLLGPYGFAGVSFSSFMAWLGIPLSQGLPIDAVIKNITYLAPFLILLWVLGVTKQAAKTFYALCFTSLVVAVVASKPGSGIQMFIPLFPTFFLLAAEAYSKVGGAKRQQAHVVLGAFALMLMLNGVNRQKQIVHFLKQTSSRIAEFNDLKELVNRTPGRVELGYAGIKEYESSFYKPWMIRHGKGLFLDGAAVMETDFTNIPLSRASLSVMETCQITTMIFPKGSPPWSITSMYTEKPIFSEEFRQIFFRRYKHVESSKFYDVYRCSGNPG